MLARPSKLLVLVALLLIAVSAGFFHQRLITAELRREGHSLRAEQRQLSSFQAEHDRLIARVAPTDDALTQPKSSTYPRLTDNAEDTGRAVPRVGIGPAEGMPARPEPLFNPRILSVAGMKPVAAWANVGLASPEAAIETQSWAFQRGDFSLAARTIVLDEDARGKVETFLSELPSSERAKYESPEYVIALLLGRFAREFSGVRFAKPVFRSPDDVLLGTLWSYRDGHSREHAIYLRRSPQGWQRVISDPEGFIASALAQLEAKPR